jgi:hypothetical protein
MLLFKRSFIILLVVSCLALAACGPKQTPTPAALNTLPASATPTSTPTFTPSPTLTDTPTPTLTDTPTGTLTLTFTPTPTLTPTRTGTLFPTFTLAPVIPELACDPNGPPTCDEYTVDIPGIGSCTVNICYDPCGDITSETDLGCQ